MQFTYNERKCLESLMFHRLVRFHKRSIHGFPECPGYDSPILWKTTLEKEFVIAQRFKEGKELTKEAYRELGNEIGDILDEMRERNCDIPFSDEEQQEYDFLTKLTHKLMQ